MVQKEIKQNVKAGRKKGYGSRVQGLRVHFCPLAPLGSGLSSNQTIIELCLLDCSIGKCLCALSAEKTTGRTLLLIFPGSAFLPRAVSKNRSRQRWCFHWKSIGPTHIRSLLHGTQVVQFPVISHRITLYLPSRSTKLTSWRKQGPRWLGYTWMPTLIMSCCPDSLQNG